MIEWVSIKNEFIIIINNNKIEAYFILAGGTGAAAAGAGFSFSAVAGAGFFSKLKSNYLFQ